MYSDAERTKLEELSYSNFPILFKDQKFMRDSLGCNRVNELIRNSKYTRPIVPSLGLLCSPYWTDDHLCISNKTGTRLRSDHKLFESDPSNHFLGKCSKLSKLCPKLRQVRGTGESKSATTECIKKNCDKSWIVPYRKVKQKFLAKNPAKNQKTKRENKRKSRPAVVMS